MNFHFTCLVFILVCVLGLERLHAVDAITPPTQTEADGHRKLQQKLNTIIVKEVDLQNATLNEAVQFLNEESKKSDPDHEGIHFVGHFTDLDSYRKITLKLKNVSLRNVLKQICAYSVGYTYIDVWRDSGEGLDQAVFFVPGRYFQIKPDTLTDIKNRVYDVKDQLGAMGARFGPGTSALYQPEKNELIVVNSPDQVELIDELLEASYGEGLHTAPGTKFIEIK